MNLSSIQEAVTLITDATFFTAFTGAGISVESNIPPFRGEDGIWSKYDPIYLDINYFYQNPEKSWKVIKEIFYDFIGGAKPNAAHYALAKMEEKNKLKGIITQNIDNLHQKAGSKKVIEYHGTTQYLTCRNCRNNIAVSSDLFESLPPKCPECNGGVLRPKFVFFGEGIPFRAQETSMELTHKSDVMLLIGTTGEIQPASLIPVMAKNNGCKIIEINVEESNYTNSITDIFIHGKATEKMTNLLNEFKLE